MINAALSQLQSLLFKDGKGVVLRLNERSDLYGTFDIALTGCRMLFSCLEMEIADLKVAVSANGTLESKDRKKVAWKEDTMVEILGQLRGQATALNLLLQALGIESILEMRELLTAHGSVLQQIKINTQSLRKAYPENDVPDSVIDTCRAPEKCVSG